MKVRFIDKKIWWSIWWKVRFADDTIEFCERPEDTLKKELVEEVGIEVQKHELFAADSVTFEWSYKDVIIKGHHVGIFYKVLEYDGQIKRNVKIDEQNDDSLGADFYEIDKLSKEELSCIANMELEKLGYNLK